MRWRGLIIQLKVACPKMDSKRSPPAVKPRQLKQNMAMSKSAKRRNRRGGANIPYKSEGVYPSIQAPGVSSGAVQKARLRNATRTLTSARVSSDGLAFLKCAFAPPDFDQTRVQGVPDKFEGKSLVKKHRLVNPATYAANTDVYYILAPSPGIAYYTATVAAGTPILATTVFTATPYSDFATLFGAAGGAAAAEIATKFRFVSNHFELVPTTNQMTWSGNVQAWKIPLAIEVRNTTNAANLYSVVGLGGCNATNANQYTGPFNLGVYTACYNTGAEFLFNRILESSTSLPDPILPADFGQLSFPAGCITGLDEQFDSLVVKISGVGANASNTAIIKTWACVEYQVLAGNSVYEYTTFSPCDELAIQIYKKVINELPVGVAFVDNESFWRRVLQIIRTMSGALSAVPGPYGLAAQGVHSLSSAVDALTL